jgi:uncharacterized membrane protein
MAIGIIASAALSVAASGTSSTAGNDPAAWIAPAVSAVSAVLAFIGVVVASNGFTLPHRLRKEIQDLSEAMERVERDSVARVALQRIIDINSARLASLRLVTGHGWGTAALYFSIAFSLGGLWVIVLEELMDQPIDNGITYAATLYLIGVVLYLYGILHIAGAEHYRTRQRVMTLQGRPSGLTPIGIPVYMGSRKRRMGAIRKAVTLNRRPARRAAVH